MTAAVIALALLSAGLGTALLVLLEKFLSSVKESSNARNAEFRLTLQRDGLIDRDAERERELLRYKGAYKIVKAQRDKHLGESIAGLDDVALRDLVNGSDELLPFPTAADHRGSDSGIEPPIVVPSGDRSGADEPG